MNDNYEGYVKRCEARFRKLYGSDYPKPDAYSLLTDKERAKVWGASLSTRWLEDFQWTVSSIMEHTALTRMEALIVFFGSDMNHVKGWIDRLEIHNDHKEPWEE